MVLLEKHRLVVEKFILNQVTLDDLIGQYVRAIHFQ